MTYFNESVQGLDKDSPVKYRGVAIGRVDQIGVAPDSKLIQVLLKIESGQKLDDDIIAQLKAVGITGSMFIELDRRKADEKDRSPKLIFPAEYPIVPSKPSDISELIRGVRGRRPRRSRPVPSARARACGSRRTERERRLASAPA